MVKGGGWHHGNVIFIEAINMDGSSLSERQVVLGGSAGCDRPFDAADLGDAT